jgi:hypothetical protein
MFEGFDVIHSYCRSDAIRDGVLIDVSFARRPIVLSQLCPQERSNGAPVQTTRPEIRSGRASATWKQTPAQLYHSRFSSW